MEKKCKNSLLTKKPSGKVIATLSVGFLLFVVIPLYIACAYAAPWYDDYDSAFFTRSFLALDDHFRLVNLWGALSYTVRMNWYAWQGTYSSLAIMALVPINHYYIGCAILITLHITSMFLFCKVILIEIMHTETWIYLSITSIVTALCILTLHSPREAYYWFNGGIHYIGMQAFELFLMVAMIRTLRAKNTWKLVLHIIMSCVLAFLVAGGNLVNMLLTALLILSLIALGIVLKNKKTWFLLIPSIIYAIGFYFNVAAPGNQKRHAYYLNDYNPALLAIINSFKATIQYLLEFKGMLVIATVLLLLVPVLYELASKSNLQFRFPLLVSLWSYCFYASGFTPSFYGMGYAGAARALNIIKINLIILCAFNMVYWLGWLCRVLRTHNKTVPTFKYAGVYYILASLLVIGAFSINREKEGVFSTYAACKNLIEGTAQRYHNEYLERVELLESDEMNPVFKPYSTRPWLINIGDLDSDPTYQPNSFMARYYGKESVTVDFDN